MKRWLAGAVVLALAASAHAQMLAAGTSELKVEGLVDFDTADGTLIDFEIFYGQFFADYIEAGLALGVADSDSLTVWRLGAMGEYNFDLGTELVPYVGAGLSYASYEVEYQTARTTAEGTTVRVTEEEDDDAIILTGTAGAKFFIAENIAISAALVLEWASEDVFAEEDDFEDTNAQIEAAMRFFF